MAVGGSGYLSCRPDVHHADQEWCPKGEMTITPLEPGRPVTLAGPEGAIGDGLPMPEPDPGAGRAQGATVITGPVERGIWSLVWLGVIIGGIGLWASWTSWWFGAVAAPAVLLVGAVGLAVTWLVKNPRSQGIQLSAMGSVVVMTLISQGIGIHTRVFYSTDSAAFNQVAARLMVHGINPYTASMNSASKLLNGASNYWTYTVTGSHVAAVSYPAGSFLFDVPAMLLGFHHEVVDWMDLYAWIITGVLIYVLVPVTVRWLAPLLLLVSLFTGAFASGGTDAAFLPFLVLAVWQWDRFGLDRSAGLARWMGPVALGLACSIKQTPVVLHPVPGGGSVHRGQKLGSEALAPGRTVPGHRDRCLRRHQPALRHLVAHGLDTGHHPPVQPAPGHRRPGVGHPGAPRHRWRGIDAAALGGRPLGVGGPTGGTGGLVPAYEAGLDAAAPDRLLRGTEEPVHLSDRPLPGGPGGGGHRLGRAATRGPGGPGPTPPDVRGDHWCWPWRSRWPRQWL